MFLSLQPHVRGKSFCAAAMVLAAISFTNDSVASPLAVGAVDRVDLKTSSVVVLGQQFHVGAGTLVTSQTSYPHAASLADVPQNALVWVEGEEKASGAVSVDALIVMPESYVPGASQLLLTGVVSSVGSDGQIRVGQLKVDITQTLASNSSPVAVGDLIEITGTQPRRSGRVARAEHCPLRRSRWDWPGRDAGCWWHRKRHRARSGWHRPSGDGGCRRYR